MEEHKLQKQIIELRILLQGICDGFDEKNANKKLQLTMKNKVLFVLEQNPKCSPGCLIEKLGIAKSNLAILCKSLIDCGEIMLSKSEGDKRNIFYSLTPKGTAELNLFYHNMETENGGNVGNDKETKLIEKKLDDVIYFLNKKYSKK